MGVTTIGGIKISRSKPKISIRIVGDTADISSGLLYITRVGDIAEEIVYPPISSNSGYVEFMFDGALFDRAYGKFQAVFRLGNEMKTSFYLQYVDDSKVYVENA